MWRLPPVVPFVVLAPRLEAYLQRLLESGESSDREQVGQKSVEMSNEPCFLCAPETV